MRVGRLHLNATGSLAVLLFAGLAGCTGEPGGPGDLDGALDFDDPNAIPIVGQVVDDEYVPLEGIELTLEPGAALTTSEENGAFRFAARSPGIVTIHVLQAGWDEAAMELNLPAEGLKDVIFILTPNADGVPYHETETRVSYTLCTASTGGGCGVPLNTYTSFEYQRADYSDFSYVIPNAGLKELLVEGTWANSTTSGDTRVFTRNMGSLFLGCNDTRAVAAGYEPTSMFFEETFDSSPIRLWVQTDSWNTEVGGCEVFKGEEGTEYWFGVRPGSKFPFPFDVDRRVQIYLTYWYWAKGDRDFTALPTG